MQQTEQAQDEPRARSGRRGRGRILLAGAVLALVLAVGGPFAYITSSRPTARRSPPPPTAS
jgi:hypothetical protein